MTSPGKASEHLVHIDYYATESIKLQQERERLLAERRARIHEASLDAPRQPSIWHRLASAMRHDRSKQPEKPVRPAVSHLPMREMNPQVETRS